MSMHSKLTKTLLAVTAAASLFIAGPSQAGQPYCPHPHGGHHAAHGHWHDHGHGHHRHAPPIRKVVVVQHRHHRDAHRHWDGRRDWRDDRRGHDRDDRRWRERRDDRRDGDRDWRR